MNTRIAFSIPVHEKIEVIKNQVQNFKHFNPGCIIVLHVSALMEMDADSIKKELSEYTYVHINPIRILSGYADTSQLYMHYINLKYLLDNNIPFDYFCIHASNDMFIKKGLEEYITGFESFTNLQDCKRNREWYQGYMAWHDQYLAAIRKDLGIDKIYGSQTEGISFSYHLAGKIADVLNKHIGKFTYTSYTRHFKKISVKLRYQAYLLRYVYGRVLYASEEIYFSTILSKISGKNTSPYVYINWENNLDITVEDITNIVNDKYDRLNVKGDIKALNFFAVKRIHRDINDPIRKYITFDLTKDK